MEHRYSHLHLLAFILVTIESSWQSFTFGLFYALMKARYFGFAVIVENIRDTPQPGEIFFNTMRYRSSLTVHRLGYFQSTAFID